MTIQLRTKYDLEKLLSEGVSSPWKINHERLKTLTDVEMYNFNGSVRIVGAFDLDRTIVLIDDVRVAIAFKNSKIEQCEYKWNGMSPVRYKPSEN